MLVLSSFLGLLALTNLVDLVSTWTQIRRYFEMPDYVGVVPEHVASAILGTVPLGASRGEVGTFLDQRRLGKDGNSICLSSDGGAGVTCTLPTHHHVWELVREKYDISFDFDSDQKLRHVVVDHQFAYL
jgi:hypothetical protein